MKRLAWRIGLYILMGVGLSPVLAAAPGDINKDGKTDPRDLNLLQQYLKGKILFSWPQTEAADLNEDGLVDAQDLTALENRLRPQITSSSGAQKPTSLLNSSNSGQVIDQKTGLPLSGALVAIPGEDLAVTTDEKGRFTLPKPVTRDQILTVKAKRYAPFSLTLNKSQTLPQQLGLEQITAKMTVLDDEVRHLGNDQYGPESANAGEFRLPAEGISLERSFPLTTMPDQDPYLKIGSLIGIDTLDSIIAGQSNLPLNQMSGNSATWAFRVYLNGTLIKRLTVNGDNIVIPLPRWLLRLGTNTVVLATGSPDIGVLADPKTLHGALDKPFKGVDYDDIELAHVLLVIPNREERNFFAAPP